MSGPPDESFVLEHAGWTAFNAETGEFLVVDRGGRWVKPALAENPKTGERLYFDGAEWRPVPITNAQYRAGMAASVMMSRALNRFEPH